MNKPILWDYVNNAYNAVMDNFPAQKEKNPREYAFILGMVGSYAVVKLLQMASRQVDRIIPGFDEKLPLLETFCVAGVVGAPLIYGIIEPENAKLLIENHPVYCAGMAGTIFGSAIAATQDVLNRAEDASLERRLE